MAFFHDIHRIKDAEGNCSVIEVEYSYEECVKRNWFDPEKCQWIRAFVEPPSSNPELYEVPLKDDLCGTVFEWMIKNV